MTAESRARYEGIQPWFSERFPEIPSELIEIYEEFTSTLDSIRVSMDSELVGIGMLTSHTAVAEMRQGTELGRGFAESLFDGTYGTLTPDARKQARLNPALLVQATVQRFRAEIEKRKVQS